MAAGAELLCVRNAFVKRSRHDRNVHGLLIIMAIQQGRLAAQLVSPHMRQRPRHSDTKLPKWQLNFARGQTSTSLMPTALNASEAFPLSDVIALVLNAFRHQRAS